MTATRIDPRDYASTVGEVLREAREDAGWSLQDVRRITSGRLKLTTLCSWERGERNVSLARLFDLARLYQIPADVLISVIEKRLQG